MSSEKASMSAPVHAVVICGTEEWLRKHALFVCDHCIEHGNDEASCRPADDLRMLDGMTICDTCWDDHPGDVPDHWTDLDEFDPFRFLSR